MRAVGGTIPTFLKRVPVNHAPHVRACCRPPNNHAVLAFVAGHLGHARPHNGPLAWRNLVDRAYFSWTDILGQMSDGLDLTVHELQERRGASERLSAGIKHRRVPAVLTNDE